MPAIHDTEILDNIIVGRVTPHIYAFSTAAAQNALKVGDTYRPVGRRLSEWRIVFQDVHEQFREAAEVHGGRLFRDFSVHRYLENEMGLRRLLPEDLRGDYYSREFFEGATPEHLRMAIEDIRLSARANDGRYKFYTSDGLPETFTYKRGSEDYEPRPNQRKTIQRFAEALKAGHRNLLMYAVMRFGKSFTAMCCAAEMRARIVVIVSAKADVQDEWKRTVEAHVKFADFDFLTKVDLDSGTSVIRRLRRAGRNIVLFLTLQDLQGDQIKERHKELFASTIDLLIVDETHYGARAVEYGKVLQELGFRTKSQRSRELKGCEFADSYEQTVKAFTAKCRLHLSGTPYRILMDSEFRHEQIVAFYQFADIVEDQRRWDAEHLCAKKSDGLDEGQKNEWDNPYFGFPQMVRFAFHPNESSRAKLDAIKKTGYTYAFSELFRPESIVRAADGSHKRFKHEEEILELLQAIDGSKQDRNLLSLLNYDRIKEGKLCRHIVCVLPFRASCDALEALIVDNPGSFLNLKDYEIINIAGVDNERAYPDPKTVKSKIQKCEGENQKTLTLTVNRMLTGSTVEQWDTMLYFKDTASPQEYDQAIFRLQSQYVRSYHDESGELVKYDMKPQTLLVDFDPSRLFQMQARKSLFYNVNIEEKGNLRLEERIAKELSISPIIAMNKDKLVQITPASVIDEVRRYSQDKSILDEAQDVPIDSGLLEVDEISKFISAIRPVDARKGLSINPAGGEGMDLDVPPPEPEQAEKPNVAEDRVAVDQAERTHADDDAAEKLLHQKLAAYYARVLFYAFLTRSELKSLSQLIDSIQKDGENRRIAGNVGLHEHELALIRKHASPIYLSDLEYKVQNINSLGRDEDLEPLERALVAMKKFARVSDTEVVMPARVADDLVALIPDSKLLDDTVVLDIAAKQGELAVALCKRLEDSRPGLKERIFSLPTSRLAFELTRKVYEALGLPLENVLNFTAFSLVGEENEDAVSRLKALGASVVVGGPPFHKTDGGGRGDSGSAMYHRFFGLAQKELEATTIAMFIKANWYSGGKGKGLCEFREAMLSDRNLVVLHDYPDPAVYLESPVNLRGGVCSILWEAGHDSDCKVFNHINGRTHEMTRPMRLRDVDIFVRYNEGVGTLSRVLESGEKFMGDVVYARNAFKIASNSEHVKGTRTKKRVHKVHLPKGRHGYIAASNIPGYEEKKALIEGWKVLVAKASPGCDELPHAVISEPFVSEPGSLCTDSHLLVSVVENEQQARNLVDYMRTKFFRFMMLLAKSNQNMNRSVFRFVPVQDLRKPWSDIRLYRRYNVSEEEAKFIDSVIKDRS